MVLRRRRWRWLLIWGTLCLPGFSRASVQLEKLPDRSVYHFTVEGVVFANIDLNDDSYPYVRTSLRGVDGYEGILYHENGPQIPCIRFFIDGPGTITVRFGASHWHVLAPGERRWAPSVPSASKDDFPITPVAIPPAAYAKDDFLPAVDYDIQTLGLRQGIERRVVTLYPVHYNPAAGVYELVSQYDVTFTPQTAASPVASSRETLAVVVGPTFAKSPSLDRYVQFKRGLGLDVRRLIVGKDATDAPTIRERLHQWASDLEHPLRYVVLVGGLSEVPSPAPLFSHGVTDHYYAALDGNYADDIGTPDVAVGRFGVTDENELAVVVAKQIKYETGDFQERGWLKRLSFLGTHDHTHWPLVEAGLNWAIDRYTRRLGYQGSFPLDVEPGGDKLFATTYHANGSEALKRFQEGRAFIDYSGHGHWDRWDGPRIEKSDLARLTNPEALPFVLSCACHTANFTEDSFAQAWQRNAHGAIAFWGSTDTSQWEEDDILQKAVYRSLFEKHELTLADLTRSALEEVWRFYGGAHRSKYYYEIYHLFGDPSTELRIGEES